MREPTSRRTEIDLGDFERQLRGQSASQPSTNDPLSELARLMQDGETQSTERRFDRLFDEGARPGAPAEPDYSRQQSVDAELRGAYDETEAHGYDRQAHDYQDYAHEAPAQHADQDGYYEQPAAHDYYAGRDDHAPADHGYPSDAAYSDDAYLDYGDEEDPASRPSGLGGFRSRFKPWHAVTVLSLLAFAGIGYGFAHRSGAIGSREIAVISAPPGPVKVAPTPAGVADQGPDKADSAVLDRQENTPVKGVVSRQEPAVEPTVEPQAGPPLIAGAQPKRVKTVLVRPDGTLVDNPTAPAAVVKATEPDAAPKSSPATTPKAAVKPPVTTSKPEKPANQKTKPPAPKAVEPASSAPSEGNTDVADASAEESGTTSAKGSYAVQFGAAGSEPEARVLMNKIATKYGAKLGGHRPSYKIATVGEKTVYRVRLHEVSKDEAGKICGAVKAGGDACFVAPN